jgi:cohesin complex subunit SA-1/2
MALGELDLSVRVQTIQVLRQIETHGLLDEEQRDEVAKLVFENERRVRHAAADFFNGLLSEEVERRETELDAGKVAHKRGAVATMEAKDQLRLKCLAELLVKYGKALDGTNDEGDEEEDQDDDEATQEDLVEVKTHRGRVAFAVEALWDDVDAVRDWQGIMDFLLLDHSSSDASNEDTPKAKGRKGKGKGKADAASDEVEDACKLTEEEETLLVEVLVASLMRVTGVSATTKKVRRSSLLRSALVL